MQFIKKIVFLLMLFWCGQEQIVCSVEEDSARIVQAIVDEVNNLESDFNSLDLQTTLQSFLNCSSELRFFLEQGINNYRYENGDTLLTRAAKNNKTNSIKLIIIIGSESNGINAQGRSALSTALIWDNYEAADVLIEYNAVIQPSDRPMICGPLLSWLIEHDKLNCIEKLDSAGIIDCNKQHGDGSTLLHLAVKYQAHNTLKYLIQEKHVDLNKQNEKSFTALHCAVAQNSPEMVKLLIDAGASQTIKDKAGKTAYNYAGTDALKSQFNDFDIVVRKKIEDCLQEHVKTEKSFSYYSAEIFAKLDPTLNKFCKRVDLDVQTLLSFVPIWFIEGVENSSGERELHTEVIWCTNLVCTKNELKQKWYARKNKINGFGHDMVNNNGDVITKKFDEHVIDEQDIARIIESYPMLAEGFDLFGLDFQDFLQKRLLGRDLHDPVFDDKKVKISILLHSAVIEAEELIKQELLKKETRQHLADIVKRDLWNSHSDTTDDPIFNYILKYEHAEIMQSLVKKIMHCKKVYCAFRSNPKLREGCNVLGIDGLALLDTFPLFNDEVERYDVCAALDLIKEEIDCKLASEDTAERIHCHYGNDESISKRILNYVKRYRDDSNGAMKELLCKYINYSPISYISKSRNPTILEQILAMPNCPDKFGRIKDLLIDTDVIKTEPVLRIAEDLETLRFLIDHGAKAIKILESEHPFDTLYYYNTSNCYLVLHDRKIELRNLVNSTMKYQSIARLGLCLSLVRQDADKKIEQDEIVLDAKCPYKNRSNHCRNYYSDQNSNQNRDQMNRYFYKRLDEEDRARFKAKIAATTTIVTALGIAGLATYYLKNK